MKMSERKFIYLFTIITSFVVMLNGKLFYLDKVWNFYFLSTIVVLNAYQLSKINKEKNEKDNK
jgi:hypothetical protein